MGLPHSMNDAHGHSLNDTRQQERRERTVG